MRGKSQTNIRFYLGKIRKRGSQSACISAYLNLGFFMIATQSFSKAAEYACNACAFAGIFGILIGAFEAYRETQLLNKIIELEWKARKEKIYLLIKVHTYAKNFYI